jgi:hypothetical protein
MRTTAATLIAGFLLIAVAIVAQDDPKLIAEGKEAWRSCATCHCATDPKIKEDEDWIKMNLTTSCIDEGDVGPRIRHAINAYLRSEKTLRPILINEEYKPKKGLKFGRIKVPPTSGSAYLRATSKSVRKGTPAKIRLYWKASEKGKELIVPAGEYRVISYFFYRSDAEGRWFISSCDSQGVGSITVNEHGLTHYAFSTKVKAKFTAELWGETVGLMLGFKDKSDNRMTLAHNSRMVAINCVIRDPGGKELARVRIAET